MEMSGLKELSTNMATAMAMKTKASPACVKMNRLPARKSWVSERTVFSVCALAGRTTVRVAIMIAEKMKLAESRTKQAFSEAHTIKSPASVGENKRTM